MAWATEGPKSLPAASALLADTGAFGLGLFDFTVIIAATHSAALEFAQRNALNTADSHVQDIYVDVGTQAFRAGITLAVNERLVVRCKTAVDGDIQASIVS